MVNIPRHLLQRHSGLPTRLRSQMSYGGHESAEAQSAEAETANPG
jgi:hypothetical protein